jgi:Putative Actinobacterial Holin-X, holin superfamily III
MTTSYDESAAPADLPIGDLVGRLSEDTSRLLRDEIRLARAEMTEKARAGGLGVGLLGGAGVCAIYGFGVLIAAAVIGLAMVVALWAAALIVAAALFVAGGMTALMGKKELQKATPPIPAEAVQSAKLDVDEVKRGLRA